MGRWLVLGGTRFLSAAVAATALARGHEVVCAARGESGAVPDGATLVRVDRNEPGALEPLRGRQFDAVVDVATMSLPWVRAALDALVPTAGHWTFVSSVSVYADPSRPGQTVDAPLLAAGDPDDYGSVKVACENAVREAVGGRAFVVRAGLICGPATRRTVSATGPSASPGAAGPSCRPRSRRRRSWTSGTWPTGSSAPGRRV